MRRIWTTWTIVTFLTIGGSANAASLGVCIDANDWYPFTLNRNGVAAGMHVDLVRMAAAELGYEVEFTPLPWRRCLSELDRGSLDAVASASYSETRAAFLHFPADAGRDQPSAWRVTDASYVVVSIASDPYRFAGDLTTLPAPVRVTQGYSIVDKLVAAGLTPEPARSAWNNLAKLVRDRTGVVVTFPDVARGYLEAPELAGLTIHPRPIESKSYFLAFSKGAMMTAEERQALWDAVARMREDRTLMTELTSRYERSAPASVPLAPASPGDPGTNEPS